jgi:hypothetical protein
LGGNTHLNRRDFPTFCWDLGRLGNSNRDEGILKVFIVSVPSFGFAKRWAAKAAVEEGILVGLDTQAIFGGSDRAPPHGRNTSIGASCRNMTHVE